MGLPKEEIVSTQPAENRDSNSNGISVENDISRLPNLTSQAREAYHNRDSTSIETIQREIDQMIRRHSVNNQINTQP